MIIPIIFMAMILITILIIAYLAMKHDIKKEQLDTIKKLSDKSCYNTKYVLPDDIKMIMHKIIDKL